MERIIRTVGSACILGLLLGALTGLGNKVFAQESKRVTIVIISYTEYEWWLINWDNNQILCQVFADHEGLPTVKDVAQSCGPDLADQWWTTPPCQVSEDKNQTSTQCTGLYLYQVSSQQKEREVVVELPMPTVWANLEGCTPVQPENRCPELPVLVLTGEEPLPDEKIISIQGIYDGEPFYCDGEICKLPMRPTPIYGSIVEFWSDSSYGDSSERFKAQVRVIDTGVSPEPGGGGWYVDVISTQWRGASLSNCGRLWEAFPPIGSPPVWLSTPERFELMASAEPYYYLAGRLIAQGLVDVSSCASGGLLPNGYADTCGLEEARPVVQEWQNQFDDRIIEVSKETGIPAQLMKNLFAQESQFWPGVFRVPFEFGLGQITEKGADAIFIWNPSFFLQFCPLVLSQETCEKGYLLLSPDEQAILRGALALQAKSDCPDCPSGVDLTNAHFAVSLFANTLQANCAQISRTIYTATNMMAGSICNFEDLWRITIANYHAGPGCVSYAIHLAWANSTTSRITWENVKPYFTEPCEGVIPYVEEITR